jgi:hypothetical protein
MDSTLRRPDGLCDSHGLLEAAPGCLLGLL